MKPTKLQYHEALYTTRTVSEFIDTSLIQHSVYENAPEEAQKFLLAAQMCLGEYYSWCCDQQRDMEDGE